MSWLDEEGAQVRVYNSMVKSAIEKGVIFESVTTDRPKLSTIMGDLIQTFQNTEGELSAYHSQSELLSHWEGFLTRKVESIAKTDTIEHLTLTITQHYGKVDIEIGLSDSFVINTPSDRMAALTHLRGLIDEMHRDQQRTLPQAAFSGQPQSKTGGEIIVDVTGIRKSNEKGKVILRVLGGQYSQHGIPLYNEVAERCGINIETLDYGDNRYAGKAVVLLRDNGSPQKVLSLE